MHRPFALLVGSLAISTLAAACGDSTTPPSPAASPTATAETSAPATLAVTDAPPSAAGTVTIRNFAFTPATISVKAGGTVTWTNADTTAHTVTADDGTFDSKNLEPGKNFSATLSAPGTHKYHCAIHSSMQATIMVV